MLYHVYRIKTSKHDSVSMLHKNLLSHCDSLHNLYHKTLLTLHHWCYGHKRLSVIGHEVAQWYSETTGH